jgi:hypothetical protein
MVRTFLWKNMEGELRAVVLPPSVRGYFANTAGAQRKAPSKASSKKGGKK